VKVESINSLYAGIKIMPMKEWQLGYRDALKFFFCQASSQAPSSSMWLNSSRSAVGALFI